MQKIKKLSFFVTCLVLVLASAFIFVGCGKDENKIRLNEVTHSIFYAPLYVAYNLGYFEDEGLKVTIESATGSDASMTALISGSADIALIGPEQVVYAENVKDRPVVFGQLTHTDGSFIVGKEYTESFTLDMLRGKTIIGGRAGGLPAMTLEYVIRGAGLTIGTDTANGEVNLRTDVSFPMIASEFTTSNSEYCTLFEPNATTLENAGNGYVLKAVGEFSGKLPYTCFTAKTSFLEKKGEQAEKFLRAVYKGYKYIATQPTSASATALMPSFDGMTQTELEIAVRQYVAIGAWGEMSMEETSFTRLLSVINTTSGTNYAPKFADLIDNSIADRLTAN
ncbi:MAG: ABC transporter substrate-binding protein [Clostridia bacterium]|nr:ABC transporter substrate-binding protein [Clostridia bacterium]